jgi:PAS domain S-box-containing protein
MLDLGNPRGFEAVVDSLEAGVYVVDRDRKIVYWNHGAERISGYLRQKSRDDIAGTTLWRTATRERRSCVAMPVP